MGDYIVVLLLIVVFGGLMLLTRRNKARAQAAEAARSERLRVGVQVMTTSGLYGTISALGDDGSARLAIAPGVEVKWAVAALRELDELPPRYQAAADHVTTQAADRPAEAAAQPWTGADTDRG